MRTLFVHGLLLQLQLLSVSSAAAKAPLKSDDDSLLSLPAARSLLAGDEAADRILFDAFISEHAAYRREYHVTATGVTEYDRRFAIFRANLKFFDEYNEKESAATGITQGITPFADLTQEEWATRFHGMRTEEDGDAKMQRLNSLTVPFVSDPQFVAPVTVDWRKPTAKLPGGAVRAPAPCSPPAPARPFDDTALSHNLPAACRLRPSRIKGTAARAGTSRASLRWRARTPSRAASSSLCPSR